MPHTSRRPSLALAFSRLRRARGGRVAFGAACGATLESRATLLLLLAGAFAMTPIPGTPIGVFFGPFALAVALPLLLGLKEMMLPRWFSERPLPPVLVARVVRWVVPLLRRIERRTRPRMRRLTMGVGRRLAYATAAGSAALVTMPVPFGNTLPALALVLIAFGLNREDGLVTLSGHLVGLVGAAWNATLIAGGVAVASWWVV